MAEIVKERGYEEKSWIHMHPTPAVELDAKRNAVKYYKTYLIK